MQCLAECRIETVFGVTVSILKRLHMHVQSQLYLRYCGLLLQTQSFPMRDDLVKCFAGPRVVHRRTQNHFPRFDEHRVFPTHR